MISLCRELAISKSNQSQIAELNATLSVHAVGKMRNLIGWPAQHCHFQTKRLIQMQVQRRKVENVVIMMSMRQSTREVTPVMVKNIAEDAETGLASCRGR